MLNKLSIKRRIIIIFIIIATIFIFISLFIPVSPNKFYERNKLKPNELIKKIDYTKCEQKLYMMGIDSINYYGSESNSGKENEGFVDISLKHNFFSGPPYYIGLIYSLDNNPHIAEIPSSLLIQTSDNKWVHYSSSGNYFKIERIDKNWFIYEENY